MHFALATFVLSLVGVEAHIALWHPSLYGFNYPLLGDAPQQNGQLNEPVNPMRGMDNFTVDEWWGHGMRNLTPGRDEFMELEAGSTVTFELGCNRAFTTYRPPEWSYKYKPLMTHCCEDNHGPLHNANLLSTPFEKLNVSLFGGTALAIAYTSDQWAVKPEEMTVISVNYTSPWLRLVDYQIPEGLPPCPKGGCICTWNWIHTRQNGEGYGSEIYNNMYKCKVTGKTNKYAVLTKPVPPTEDCENAPDKCTPGPKQPMYMWQKTGNNLPNPPAAGEPPIYRTRFVDGAQQDAFSGAVKATPSVLVTLVLGGLVFVLV